MFKKYISRVGVLSFIFALLVLIPLAATAEVLPLNVDNLTSTKRYNTDGSSYMQSNFTNTEALGDLQQAKVDAANLYNTAIKRGVSPDAAQTQANNVLQAGITRAQAKQDNLGGISGWFTSGANEATIKADAAYQQALTEAATNVGNEKQASTAASSASTYTQTANNVANGNVTGSDNQAPNSFMTNFMPQGKTYTLLAPIETFFPGGTIDIAGGGLSKYLDGLYKAGIAIATGLALIMIVIGGLQYVSTDAIGGKSEGKNRIQSALIGLLLALGSYILLQQINPALLKNDFNVEATKSTGKVDTIDIQLSNGTVAPDIRAGVDVSGMPYTSGILNSTGIQTTLPSGFKATEISNMQWRAYTVQQIQSSGLISARPSDAANFFPGGQITVDGWVGIIGGIIKKESNFNPNDVYREPAPLNKNSVGLLSLSADDPEARAANCNETCLKDPLNNIRIGIQIMVRQLRRVNCIVCKNSSGRYQGISEYWSTVR